MLPYSYIDDASLTQLLRWWEGTDLLPEDFDEDGIYEVAYALSTHKPEGVQTLKRFLESSDMLRRRATLHALADPEIADAEIRAALITAFRSEDPALITAAFWGFIQLQYFPLEQSAIKALMEGMDQRLAALAMVYLSQACPDDSVSILRGALQSPNPRMREYACNEIGDRGIVELKDEMRTLLDDPDADVAQTAAYCLDQLEDG